MTIRLTFLGGAGTVTGSKYLIEAGRRRILVDCGLYQGLKQLRLRNWAEFPVPPETLDAVVLTHAHLDHSGYLPRLVREGFSGAVICTAGTRDLSRILLLDSAMLMEEEAENARRHGYSSHRKPEPLYTAEEARRCFRLFRSLSWNQPYNLGDGLEVSFIRAGHILGAASAVFRIGDKTLVFSGDLGRDSDPMFPPPDRLPRTDWLVVESTYGDRLHEPSEPSSQLEAIVARTAAGRGVLLIPSFAVGRTQSLLYQLWQLRQGGRLPPIPIYVDSPMAAEVTDLYAAHPADHALGARTGEEVFAMARYVRATEESRELLRSEGPMIIIAGSGMATGGRILHHLKAFAPKPETTILLAGYQAAGTRGAALLAGEREIKIHGRYIPVAAKVEAMRNFSAHADAAEIVRWIRAAGDPPRRIFITHGEPAASDALRQRIRKELGWSAEVPDSRDTVILE